MSNILSEKLTLGSVLNFLKSSKFKNSKKDIDNKKLKSRLDSMNKDVEDIEKLLNQIYGGNRKLSRYTMKDLKGK